MNEKSIQKMLDSILNKKHSETKEHFNELIREKIADRMEEQRIRVASKLLEKD
jgi:hypothetical protein